MSGPLDSVVILLGPTDRLQIVTVHPILLDVIASYEDSLAPSSRCKQSTRITTATRTDIVNGPDAGIVRMIVGIFARNRSENLSGGVSVIDNDNGVEYELCKTTLDPGATLVYLPPVGFFISGRP